MNRMNKAARLLHTRETVLEFWDVLITEGFRVEDVNAGTLNLRNAILERWPEIEEDNLRVDDLEI